MKTHGPFAVWGLVGPLLIVLHHPSFARAEPAPGVPSHASDQRDEADLAELEAALAADQTQSEAARPAAVGTVNLNPDVSIVLDMALAVFSAAEPLQTGGHDPRSNGFTLQQLELDLSKVVDPYFRLDAFLGFHAEGVEVEEVFATTLALPASLQLRVGQMLTRFGRQNSQHPHSWDFADQPFVLGRYFSGEGQRGAGAELSWLTPLPWYVELVGSSSNASSHVGHDHEEESVDEPVNSVTDLLHVVSVKQFFDLSENWSLFWGVSGSAQRGVYIGGTDLYVKYRPITRSSATVVEVQAESFIRKHDEHRDFGLYAQLGWRFARRWGTGLRYEYGSTDELDMDAPGERHRITGRATFWATEYSRVRLQSGVDYPTWQDKPDVSVMLTGEFIMGAHGAHKF